MKRFVLIVLLLFSVISLGAYNQNFERKYNSAKAKYEQGQYDSAKKEISTALNTLPNLSSEQKEKGNKLLALCNQKISNQNRLNLGSKEIIVSFDYHRDSISIDAGKPNLLKSSSSAPDWCVVEGISGDYLFFHTEFNKNKAPREAVITVKMGNIKSQKISIRQEGRPETTKKVIIKTSPDRAKISVDGSESLVGTWVGTLSSGNHRIHVEKNEYVAKDTVITILDDFRQKDTVEYRIPLSPRFSKLDLKIEPEEGFDFNSDVVIKVNGEVVSVSGFAYDDEREEVRKRTVYNDGTIPVSSGTTLIQVSSEHFVPYEKEVRIPMGETYRSDIRLSAITGYLSLFDEGHASDARVLLDGKDIGSVSESSAVKTLVGNHSLTFYKEGYHSAKSEYPINIIEGESSIVEVSMERIVPYVFKSSPSGAQIYVDGKFVGITPTREINLQEHKVGHTFDVLYQKDGYLPIHRKIQPDYTLKAASDSVDLWESFPYSLTADEDNIVVTITNEENEGLNFYDEQKLPADIVLPLRSKPYKVTAWRSGQKYAAYRGELKFDNPENNQKSLRMWSKARFQLITLEYTLLPFKLPFTDFSQAHQVRANLASFKILSGLSTSVLRGSAFLDNDFKHTLPAVSFILLNGDFRMGGSAFSDWADANLLVSYAWYPPIWDGVDFFKDNFQFNHLSGHDLFIGVEVSGRLRYITPTLKLGYQMFPGMKLYTADTFNKKYIIDEAPLNNQFVISLVISLSVGKDAKGNNIWRIWHL